YHRGITSHAAAEKFLNPDWEADTHDAFLMKDMEKAVDRILRAIEKNERIIIYSDYDTDGIPGAVVVHDFFTKIGFSNFRTYIPHRIDEGFGLNEEAVRELSEDGGKLLITIDCGIADVKEVKLANSLCLDVIITDHHVPGEVLPPAYAIVNPKQAEDRYPYQMLCGCGVAFKLIQGILARNNFGLKPGLEKWFLDMVGIATLSDMVPLKGENRVLAYYGLKVLQKSPRLGLARLLRKLRVRQSSLSEDDIGFSLSPRINAASRMGIPMEAFKLLTTTDETVADMLADYLNDINEERKGMVAAMVKEMRRTVEERLLHEKALIVLGNPKWKPSLLGLAANTLREAYGKSTFLWGREGGDEIKGSCRSDGTVNLVTLMQKVSPGVLKASGGHAFSGGFSVSAERIHELEEALLAAHRLLSPEESKVERAYIDGILSLEEVNWEIYRMIEKLAPFGEENPKPHFLFSKISIKALKKFGKQNNHLELTFETESGARVKAIKFFSDPKFFELQAGSEVDLIAMLENGTFGRYPELRLRIVDIEA
ncbi:MAG: single-stranded-DNA-specific exonuclease RecJ, partial [bacterium]|nr:single-stranded-DNA-specific exonuclease RecJ [bacterium]